MNSTIKKFISATIAVAITASISMVAFAETEQQFTDMPNDWRTEAIENAVKNGLISGMGDGTVAPDANIKRAEMAAIIVRAFGAKKETDISGFSDISKDKWYYTELSKAVYMGAFSGDDENKMNPENNITFQECFSVLSRVFGLDVFDIPSKQGAKTRITKEEAANALALYADGGDVASWAVPYYGSIVAGGYWSGGENMLLRPTEYITRGEFAVVMNNLVKTYISEPGTVTELPEGNALVRCDGVILDSINHKGDIIIGDGVTAGTLSMKNVNVEGRVVFRGCTTLSDDDIVSDDKIVIDEGTKDTDFGCVPSGYISDLQMNVPYLYINVNNLKTDIGNCVDGSTYFYELYGN